MLGYGLALELGLRVRVWVSVSIWVSIRVRVSVSGWLSVSIRVQLLRPTGSGGRTPPFGTEREARTNWKKSLQHFVWGAG